MLLDFKDDFVYYNPARYLESLSKKHDHTSKVTNSRLISSPRFYFDRARVRIQQLNANATNKDFEESLKQGWIIEDDIVDEKQYKQFIFSREFVEENHQPFYFKKWEVTNEEYFEFIDYVIDSIAHTLLGHLNEDKTVQWYREIDWTSNQLNIMFHAKRHEGYDSRYLDRSLLKYTYTDEKLAIQTVNVYPDTLTWNKHFQYSYNNPMIRNYFWRDKYKNYPVVGINYYQALAFCHWKTQQINELNKSGYKLKVLLPSEIEWEWIATDVCLGCSEKYKTFSRSLIDKSWITDLQLFHKPNSINDLININEKYDSRFEINGAVYTYEANPNVKSIKSGNQNLNETMLINLDQNGIWSMGSNVSEWMRNSYDDWKVSFQRNQQKVLQRRSEDAKLAYEIYKYFDGLVDKDGMLVRGGNWYDERYSYISGKNKAGINAKTFVSPEKNYPTLGFRYVIHIILPDN